MFHGEGFKGSFGKSEYEEGSVRGSVMGESVRGSAIGQSVRGSAMGYS